MSETGTGPKIVSVQDIEIERLQRRVAQLEEELTWVANMEYQYAATNCCAHHAVKRARAALAADAGKWLAQQRREVLSEAAKVIRRGVKAAERQEWEPGQTQGEWIAESRHFLSMYKLANEIKAELRRGGK